MTQRTYSISLDYDSSADPSARDERLIAWAFTLGAALLAVGPTVHSAYLCQCLWAGWAPPIYGAGLPYTVFVPVWVPALCWCAIRGAWCLARRTDISLLAPVGGMAFGMACIGGVLLHAGIAPLVEGGEPWRKMSTADRWASAFEVIGEPAPAMCLLLPLICRRSPTRATWRRRALSIALAAFVMAGVGSASILPAVCVPDWLAGGSLSESLPRIWRSISVSRRVYRLAAWITAFLLLVVTYRRSRLWPALALAAAMTYAAAIACLDSSWKVRTDEGVWSLFRQLDTHWTFLRRAACMLLTIAPPVWLSVRTPDPSLDAGVPDQPQPVSFAP